MGAALSIFVLMSLSVFVIRLASVALRITGLPDDSARFQALSAFTGTGFTTREAESIVNYPVRRRIVGLLMIIGNLGLVTVFATLVVSLVNTEGEARAIAAQLGWLVLGLGLLWFLMLNRTADRMLCAGISRLLERLTVLGKRPFHRLLQVADGYSVCEHPLPHAWEAREAADVERELRRLGLGLITVRAADDTRAPARQSGAGKMLVLFGPDHAHDSYARFNENGE